MRGFRALFSALVLRPLLREKRRSLLTVAGIAVGVAVLVAIQLSNQSALRAFTESVDAISGRANFQIVSDAAPLDEAILLRLQPLWDRGGRFAPVIDVDGLIEPSEVPIRILGVDLLSDLHFRDYRYAWILTRNRSERPRSGSVGLASYFDLFREDSVIVPQSFATEQGLRLGSHLQLSVLGTRRTFVVRGLLEAAGPATAFNGSLAIVDIATAQKAFGLAGKISRVDLMIPENDAVALGLARSVAPANARMERPSRRNERVGTMLLAFRTNLFALAAIALVVGVFLVYNTVLISILRRRGEVGVLKTLGAGPGQIFAAFLCEGAVFGLVGSALGVLLGRLLAWSVLDLIGRSINALYVSTSPQEISLSGGLIGGAVVVGTLVSILAAVQPALEASAVRPNALIRPGIYVRMAVGRTRLLAGISIGGFALAALLSRVPPVGNVPVAGYGAVLFVIVGFSLLAPLLISGTARALCPLLERWAGVSGKLAAVSLPASLRRVAVAGAALSIAIGMMVAVAMMVGSFRKTVQVWVAQTVRSDLWLRPAHGLSNAPTALFPERISDDLRQVPFIAAFDRFRGKDLIYRDHIVNVGSGDFDVSMRFADLPMVTPRSSRRALGEAIRQRGVIVSESFALKFGVRPGQSIELPVAQGIRTFPVTGIYRDYSNDRGVVVMDRALFKEAYADSNINTVAVFLRKGVDPERARVALERRLGPKYGAFGFTNASIRREVMRIFDQTFLITYALLAVAVIVAVLGIVNTLSALILERRREIAVLRLVGMSAGQIRSMIMLESSLLGVASTILGVASGLVLTAILIYVINRQSFGWTIEFAPPVGIVSVSLLVTFAATVVSGLAPARLAERAGMASALKSE